MVFTPSSRRDGSATLLTWPVAPFDAAVGVSIFEGVRFHTDAWVVSWAASPLPHGAWLVQCPSRSHPQGCTGSKNKPRYLTFIEQFPWLDEHVCRPRVKNPSTRRAAASENRTGVEEEEEDVDRDPVQVAWVGLSAVTEFGNRSAYVGEASLFECAVGIDLF